ncbi:MAG: type II toxin-antitoxin system VapB family antitoxin [Kiritimatiellaeota bacterium]|nr:type II toxin-antitoxin system VapB family antitoxin [Kiritimatiellota bacterium]
MKTTLEIDEKRLRSVMALTGLKTRRAAVDYSLAEVERQARVSKVMERAWSPERLKDVLAPRYDVVALRERERPGRT